MYDRSNNQITEDRRYIVHAGCGQDSQDQNQAFEHVQQPVAAILSRTQVLHGRTTMARPAATCASSRVAARQVARSIVPPYDRRPVLQMTSKHQVSRYGYSEISKQCINFQK